MIALNMALNGSTREETAHYLSENFQLDDPEALARRGLRARLGLAGAAGGRRDLDQVAVGVADVGHVLAPRLRLGRRDLLGSLADRRSKAACTSSVTKQTSKVGWAPVRRSGR